MLLAYFDASATNGNREGVFAVGGFVGSVDAWRDLEEKWKDGLSTFQLDEFHLANIYPTMGHELGSLCVLHFSKIAGRSSVHGIGASCDVEHWRARDTGYDIPYHFCFSAALWVLEEHVGLEFPNERVAVIVDDDVKPRDITEDIFRAHQEQNKDRLMSLTFGDRHKFLPLQCADLAVGALRKDWLEGLMSKNQKGLAEFYGAIGHQARFTHFSADTEAAATDAINRLKPQLREN